ncbi:KH domain-containing, RNA-binding, signal transduction-associated protein 3-like isoform X3 [Bactrocera neohumeralis]|uniref:KH domain-containing, RNA-binding, signal transduction-associated protein 3 isoform X1 n=1 Tax=Bactrocera dorsalis TaxID=27457 RepID=A0A8N4KZG9_BACDO|nr:KH domain-containing, RNA-binding, signal transduction-associated protein 3 isoform X1 [Bactrocera dorsalis]XP_039960852.1 KH domain-containing, RNA-binding, signal transduction-associated protein 3-like isoform X3 [Bactrocera tryoni]XP_050330224.1 KH domain-containing, RNA-binding, signal transduction-associated protein 3-like isoform X3 [Bactrocera neohumeralis]
MASNFNEEGPTRKNEEYEGPRINGVAQKFLADLNEERERLGSEFPLCVQVIDEAIERVYTTGRIPGTEYLADVYKQKPMKITQKVFVPVKQYPKFNFTGKLLGPKGNSLRRLHEETQCKIIIKGRGSMRDRNKEEELRQSGDPQHAHLNRDLFIEISTVATPAEAHARIAYALAEIRKYLVPDKNDEVSQEQLRELMEIDPKSAETYSKTVLNKFSTGEGASKFLNLIKHHGASPESLEEQYEEIIEYQPRIPKRTIPTPYIKVIPSTVPIKRPPTTVIGSGFKRTRETAVKPYKPIYQSIIRKYK